MERIFLETLKGKSTLIILNWIYEEIPLVLQLTFLFMIMVILCLNHKLMLESK